MMAKPNAEDVATLFKGLSVEDQQAILAASDLVRVQGGNILSNPAPAIEEGPHLKDPKNREAKRQQMIDAGMSPDDDDMTDDMQAILREKGN